MSRRERLSRWCADEDGASRMDRAVMAFGGVALVAVLAVSLMRDGASSVSAGAGEGSAATGEAAAPQRVIASAGRAVPEPPLVEGAGVSAHASPSLLGRDDPRPDVEAAILTAQTQQAIAELEAQRAAEEEAARAAEAAAQPAATEAQPAAEAGAASGADGS